MYDIVIKGATIIDGTGKKAKKGDLAIKGDKISKIGTLHPKEGKILINASGLTLTPGFIDVLNHADTNWMLFRYPQQESMLKQGVTTIIGGNCGSSLAPLITGDSLLSIQKWADMEKVNVNWQGFDELESELARKQFGVNFFSLIGHSTIRRGILKEDLRDLTKEEMDRFRYLIEKSISQGALGLSMGLAFAHARDTKISEIIELAKVVKKAGGVLAIHLRNESDKFFDSLNEIIEVAKSSEVSIEISHFKARGSDAWQEMDLALRSIDRANKEGLDINFDFFPYDFSASVLYTILPDWVTEGGKKKVLGRLKNHDVQKMIIDDIKESKINLDNIIIATAGVTKNYVGRSIQNIADKEGISPEEMLVHILIANDDKAIAFMKTLSYDNIKSQILSPYSICASDGFGVDQEVIKEGILVHPRCYGSFPKFIEDYSLKNKWVPIEEMISKMTGMPAKKYKIKDRGVLREGNFADLALMNLNVLKSRSTIDNPFLFPEGVDYVFVNGKIAVMQGKYSGVLAGQTIIK